MTGNLKRDELDFDVQIGNDERPELTADEVKAIREHIKKENAKRTPKQRLETELFSLKLRIQYYLEQENITADKVQTIEAFVKAYLTALNITFKTFASAIDTSDGNLKKYISGERKFNTDLAMKFGSFFHTSPDIWLSIYMKNELYELKKEKEKINHYKKYNYEKVMS